MGIIFFFKGLITGLLITAPVGPVGVLCVNRTLSRGLKAGFVAGLGAVTADAFYGAVAAYGLTAISSVLSGHQFWLRTIGGFFLVYLGIKIFMSRPLTFCEDTGKGTLISEYLSTLALTLTNPLIIVAFAGIFAGLGVGNVHKDFLSATMIVAGVIAGSALGWLILSLITDNLCKKTNSNILAVVNKASGAIILVFAAFILGSVVLK